MRNALILLAVVALVILAVGALNNGTAFDIDYAAGTVSSVSLFWVSAVIAALVFVVGLAAAWFAQAAVAGSRRKLEAELQSTYERLREAEALAARPAPVEDVAPAVQVVAATVVARPAASDEGTVVVREDETLVAGEEATVLVAEEETVVVAEDAAPAAGSGAHAADEAAETTAPEPGEATAVTLTGAAPDVGEAGPADAGDEAPDAGEPDDEPGVSSAP